MRKWVVPVLAALIAVAAALPAKQLERVKRADETVMFGNQQNLAHKSVKKSGPAPPNSKLAEKQEKIAESHIKAALSGDDPVAQLDSIAPQKEGSKMADSDIEKDLHTLVSHGPSESDAPIISEEKKRSEEDADKKKKAVDINMGEKPKREDKGLEDKERKEFEDELQARYLYLLNKLDPEAFAYANSQTQRRRKRAATVAFSGLSKDKLQRLRRDLSKFASESNMAVSAQHRKKRDVGYDPRSLAMLEYMLSAANDGYDAPEEVVEPSYEGETPMEFDPVAEEEREEPERVRRDLLDDYSNYAIAKRVPDFDEGTSEPGELLEEPSSPEVVLPDSVAGMEEAEPEEEVSVYESEYGPVSYGLIRHEGVDGLFVPLEQPSMRRLMAAEKKDREEERDRLRTLATILSLNQEKRK